MDQLHFIGLLGQEAQIRLFSHQTQQEECLRELALFLVTPCIKWINSFQEERNPACIWGYTLYINTFSYAADVKFKLFWLNKGISDTCIKKCMPVFFKFTDKMSNAYLNTPAPSISYWIHRFLFCHEKKKTIIETLPLNCSHF